MCCIDRNTTSNVTICLYRFRSISIRFFDQQFDLDSIWFQFFTICTPLLTQLDSCVAAWERQCCGAGHPWSYPPTAAIIVGLNREDVEWANTDQTVWRCDTELKLPSWTARRHTLTLSIVLAPCSRCPLSDVRTSPTLVNRPTCLRAYNTRGCR